MGAIWIKDVIPTHDQVFKAIEAVTDQHIVCFHDEANNYAFKRFSDQTWHTIDRLFINGIAIYK